LITEPTGDASLAPPLPHRWRRLAIVLTLVGVTYCLHLSPVVGGLDETLRDAFLGWLARDAPVPGTVMIAAVDEPSLESAGEWPWSHERLLELLKPIFAARPPAIGLGANLTRVFLAAGPEALARLRAAAGDLPLVLCLRPAPELPESLAKRARLLDQARLEWGVWSHHPDRDGVVRHAELTVDTTGTAAPSFETRLALHAQAGTPAGRVSLAPPGLRSMRIAFAGPARTFPSLSLLRLGRGEIPASSLAGKLVVVDVTAGSAARLFSTPTTEAGRLMAEVEVSANVLHGLLTGSRHSEPSWQLLAALHAASALVFFNLVRWLGIATSYYLLAFVLAATLAAAALALTQAGLVLPVAAPIALNVALFAAVLRFKLTDRERRIRNVLLAQTSSDLGGNDRVAASLKEQLVVLGTHVEAQAMALLGYGPAGKTLQVEAATGFGRQAPEQLAAATAAAAAQAQGAAALEPRLVVMGDLFAGHVLLVPLATRRHLLGYWLVVPRSGEQARLLADDTKLIKSLAHEVAYREFGRGLLSGERAHESSGWSSTLLSDQADRELEDVAGLSQQTLRERDFFLGVLERLEPGIFAGNLLGRVTFVNSSFARAVGSTREELLKAGYLDVMARLFGASPAELRALLAELTHGRKPIVECEYRPPEGRNLHLVSWATLEGAEGTAAGGLSGFVCTTLDISRHRELDRLKTNMLELVALRVRNLLAVILGYGEEFLDFRGTIPEAIEAGLTVHRNASTLAKVFEDFEAVSRFGLTSDRLQRVPMAVGAVLESAAHSSAALASQRDCQLETVPPASNLAPARGDPVFFERALEAILYQSLLQCPAGGRSRVSCEAREGRVVVEVADNGFGLSEEVAARFFDDPPEAAPKVEVWQTAGQLLPHQVRRALEEMGGGVELTSRVGAGTVYRLWLPRM
jgi:two-component system phosphate regulon sensor histidine kinase PhoR